MTTINGMEFHDFAIQHYWQPPASWTPEKKKITTQNRIFSGDWIGSRKYDGAFYRFIKYDDGTMELLGRSKGVNGDYLNKIANVPHLMEFFNSLPNGTCLLGEIVYPYNEGSKNTTKVMGALPETAIAYQKKNGFIKYYIFDVLAYNGISYIDSPAKDRFDMVNTISNIHKHDDVFYASFYTGQELWDILQEILATGGEGIVMTRANSLYQPDKRPSKDCQKVKKELQDTIDAVVIGALPATRSYGGKELSTWKYWENLKTGEKFIDDYIIEPEMTTHTYQTYKCGESVEPITKMYYLGGAGSLRVGLYKDGKLVEIGTVSGIDEDILINWKDYVGCVVELGAMQIMYDDFGNFSGLRHPRVVGWRKDKNANECLWEQLEL